MSLSISDYDSAELGLAIVERLADEQARESQHLRLQVRSELLHICHYACVRKASSKAGSVLILRFFHGYYPGEIARILGASRRAVEEWLRLARAEARTHHSKPRRLNFLGRKTAVEIPPLPAGLTTDEMVRHLRKAIFATRQGVCLSDEVLEGWYGAGEHSEARPASSIHCSQLSHLVSCPSCLERVNRRLGLDALIDRDPTGRIGKDGGSGEGPGGTGTPTELKRRLNRRAEARDEHHPQELCIAVNGYVRGTQRVISAESEQALNLNPEEEVSFFEVFSEQGVRLLYCDVAAARAAGLESRVRATLSDGRTVEARLDERQAWPTLQVVYCDPALGMAGEIADELETVGDRGLSRTGGERRGGLISLHLAEADSQEGPRYEPPALFEQGRAADLIRGAFWLRPGVVAVLLASLLAVGLLSLRTRVTTVTAAELLDRAETAEAALTGEPDRVAHRIFDLETRVAGQVVSHHRVELWQQGGEASRSGRPILTARRLFDDQRRLLAGEWKTGEGRQTLYRKGAEPERKETVVSPVGPESERQSVPVSKLDLGDVWRLTPTAAEFAALVGRPEAAQVEEDSTHYRIKYQPVQTERGSKLSELVGGSLTLSKPGLQVMEMILAVSQPNAAAKSGGTHSTIVEYRFTVARLESQPSSTIGPTVFTPDAELIGRARTEPPAANHQPLASAPALAAAPTAAVPATVASAELEVEVLSLLNQVKADLNEPVALTRLQNNTLRVEALVDTPQRKAEILGALKQVIGHPAVSVEVSTVAEAAARQQARTAAPSGAAKVQEVEVAANILPVDAELRRYFSRTEHRPDPREGVDQSINRFATRITDRTFAATNHAWALNRLARRFSAGQLRALAPSAREQWRAMIASHARMLEQETEAVRRALQPIFFAPPPNDGGAQAEAQAPLAGDAALLAAIEDLFELSTANEKALRAAFTLSSEERSAPPAVKAPAFWRALKQTEALAARIQDFTKLQTPPAKPPQ